MSVLPCTVLTGNRMRFSMTFRDDAGTLIDPSVVTCHVGFDDTEGTALDVTRLSAGTYQADWDNTAAAPGDYWVLARGTGSLVAAREIRIKVRSPHLL